jgi:hypothetical protein
VPLDPPALAAQPIVLLESVQAPLPEAPPSPAKAVPEKSTTANKASGAATTLVLSVRLLNTS